MKNCLILGFGRSGTSLMAGILHHTGYFLGDDLYPPRESNPKGFFENELINGINEKILEKFDYIRVKRNSEPILYNSSPFNPIYGQRWMNYIEPETAISYSDEDTLNQIRSALSVPVFAYKDPRFSYTLPVWKPYLPKNVVYICMFRQPEITVESVLKDCLSRYKPDEFYITRELIYTLWYNNYQRILNSISCGTYPRMIFVHYEQLLSKDRFEMLSQELEVELDDKFISPELNRSRSISDAPVNVLDLYSNLCELAGYRN